MADKNLKILNLFDMTLSEKDKEILKQADVIIDRITPQKIKDSRKAYDAFWGKIYSKKGLFLEKIEKYRYKNGPLKIHIFTENNKTRIFVRFSDRYKYEYETPFNFSMLTCYDGMISDCKKISEKEYRQGLISSKELCSRVHRSEDRSLFWHWTKFSILVLISILLLAFFIIKNT